MALFHQSPVATTAIKLSQVALAISFRPLSGGSLKDGCPVNHETTRNKNLSKGHKHIIKKNNE